MRFENSVRPLGTILNDFVSSFVDKEEYDLTYINDRKVTVNEDYQRNFVWNDATVKSELICSVLNEYPIGILLFKIINDKNNDLRDMHEVVDGQQRLTTLKMFVKEKKDAKIIPKVWKKFVDSRYEDFEERSNNNPNDKKLKDILKNYKENVKKYISWNDLPEFLKRKFNEYTMPLVLINATDEEIRDYFRVVQNQEKLKAGEIINSITDTPVLKEFDKSELNIFADKINFIDTNQDLLKQLTVLFGLYQGKLNLNMPDKDIVEKSKFISYEFLKNDISFNNKLENLKRQISESEKFDHSRTMVFSLKLLLLSYFYSESTYFINLSLSEKVKIVNSISFLVGYFNSSDLEKRERIPESFRKNIEEIWKLSKTTQSRDSISKVIHQHFDILLENEEFLYSGWSSLKSKHSYPHLSAFE